jgi:putative transposase
MWDSADAVYTSAMPTGLVRLHNTGNLHFLTFSCHERKPYLLDRSACTLFEAALEKMRLRYDFILYGYVIMPEHIHLLLSEPKLAPLSTAVQAIKLSVAVQQDRKPFWMHRYHDFNVFTEAKRLEKLRYLHRNPVKRGLVVAPEDWPWSSFDHYATGCSRGVEIESQWTANARERAASAPTSQNRDVGHPHPTPTSQNRDVGHPTLGVIRAENC